MREEIGKGGIAFGRRIGIEHDLQHAQERIVFDDEEGRVGHGVAQRVMRFGVDLQRLADPRVHVVGADQHRQLDDLALVEVLAQLREHGIRHVDLARHGVGIGERRALALVEERRRAPVGERGAFLLG